MNIFEYCHPDNNYNNDSFGSFLSKNRIFCSVNLHFMKVSTEIDNNFGYEKITQLVDNIPLMCKESLIFSNSSLVIGCVRRPTPSTDKGISSITDNMITFNGMNICIKL